MQETLDTIVGEYQSEANKNRMILHSSYCLWHNWCVKQTEKKSFCNILRVGFIFFALHKFGCGDKFIHMIKFDSHDIPVSNLKLK